MPYKVLVAALLLSLPASISSAQQSLSRQIPADDFNFQEFRLRDGTMALWIASRAIFVDGKVEMCGAAVIPTSIRRQDVRRSLRRAKIYVNGQVVLQNLSFYEQPRSVARPEDAVGNCVATNIPASEIREGSVRVEYRLRGR